MQKKDCTTASDTSIDEITKNLDPNQVGLCYTKRITMMKELEENYKKHGIKTISIWSIRNQEHIMNEEQLRVREQILHHFTLPSEYKMLIINSSCETSKKIKSHIDYVIVHCANKDPAFVAGKMNVSELARICGLSRPTVYRYLELLK